MDSREELQQQAQFLRMAQAKTWKRSPANTIGGSLVSFYKSTVQRTRRFAGIGAVWETLIPADINEHCCLEGYRAGTLTVLVDSSPHLFRLKQLLLGGVQKQLLELCRAQGLKKITLKPGRWYEGENSNDRRLTFGE